MDTTRFGIELATRVGVRIIKSSGAASDLPVAVVEVGLRHGSRRIGQFGDAAKTIRRVEIRLAVPFKTSGSSMDGPCV